MTLPALLDAEQLQRQIDLLRGIVINMVTEMVASGTWSPNKARHVLGFQPPPDDDA